MQVVITIVILKTKSLLAGAKCFLIYNAVSWVLFSVITLLYLLLIHGRPLELTEELALVLMGCNAAAAGIMVRSSVTFFSNFTNSTPKMILILLCAALFLWKQNVGGLMSCMLLGGIVSMYLPI